MADEESKIIDDPQNFCGSLMDQSSIMVDDQIAPSMSFQDIKDNLMTPMGDVSDDEEEEKQQSSPNRIVENENYLDNLTELFKKIKIMGKPISF